jgi:hypothetical protein
MFGVVVKVKIGLKLRQELALIESAQKHRLIDVNAPMHERPDGAFVGGGTSCRHQGNPDTHPLGCPALGPQSMERFKQRLEWSRVERLIRALGLMTLERVQPLSLKHPLGLI